MRWQDNGGERRPGWMRKLASRCSSGQNSQSWTGILTLSARITVRWPEMDLRKDPSQRQSAAYKARRTNVLTMDGA
jgi:hypothetical protein